jgi:broad specificity phosphatase PhoE
MRHAESIKNIKDLHGGSGEALTKLGAEQALNIAKFLQDKFDINNMDIYCPDSLHAKETAEIIAHELKKDVLFIKDFKPLHLGVISGKSNAYVKKFFPKEYEQLLKWRNREIEINELSIPNMEDIHTFWARGEKIIKSLLKERVSLLVCTNSLIILLYNMMLNHTPSIGGGYRHIDVKNCGIIAFDTVDFENFYLDKGLTDVVLP